MESTQGVEKGLLGKRTNQPISVNPLPDEPPILKKTASSYDERKNEQHAVKSML